MAKTSKVIVSPGVYSSEYELPFVAQSIGVTSLGVVGEAQKGPAFEPVRISNFDEYITFFGDTSPEKFTNTQIPKYEAAYIAKAYLQQSNQMYMTRILGLSGYDAGPSWSLMVNANMDYTTVSQSACTTYCYGGEYLTSGCTVESPVSFTVSFTGSTCSMDDIVISGNTAYANNIGPYATQEYIKFNGSVSTLEDDIKTQVFKVINNTAISGSSIYYYGSVPATAATSYSASTNAVNVFTVADPRSFDQLDSRQNDSWYFATFDQYDPDVEVLPNGESVTPNYSGISFYTTVTALNFVEEVCVTGATPDATTTTTTDSCSAPIPPQPDTEPEVTCCSTYTGTLSGTIYTFFGKQYNEYQNLVVATLRSRGVSRYIADNGPEYEISKLNYVGLDCFKDSYGLVTKNPFMPFSITGFTDAGKYFNFKTSLANTDKNFIDRVFGETNFGKPKADFPLMVEENYSNLLTYGWNKGFVRGLKCDLLALDGARSNSPDSLGWYLDRYQTPITPYIVSELRGNKVFKLFKFHSISDGGAANTEVKVSIANISFTNGTFDVLVRKYDDSDQAPQVLEKYSRCTMDPKLNSFVGKRIGTVDGDYALKSKFVMVELSNEFPEDALPCGFEGYVNRAYSGQTSPFIPYKTKYDYVGEIISNPPFGTLSGSENAYMSKGDKVRNVYLGISTSIPVDPDMFQYKGRKNTNSVDLCTAETADEWDYMTKGFHMDKDAAAIVIPAGYLTSGKAAYAVGNSTFSSEPSNNSDPYFPLQSRKFTVCFQGGFDGWDIYSEKRTNADNFQLGGTGYKKGACPSIRYPDATGVGMFKQISVDDNFTEYANTDFYAYLYGIRQFANPEAININVLATPGIDYVNNTELVERTITMVEAERADSIYIITSPDMDMMVPNATNKEDLYSPDDIADLLEGTDIDSSYAATYYTWVLTRDSAHNTQVYIPPTAEVCRNIALTDNKAYPWFATAGYDRGLVNCVKARKKLSQEDRDTLYKNRINPIATFLDVREVIWGNKTLQKEESATNQLSVRRLMLQARKLIAAASARLLFDQNDDQVARDFLNAVNPILDGIRRDRGLYKFKVAVKQTTEDMDEYKIVGKIFLQPTKALEVIELEYYLTPTGASFENI